MIFVSDIIIFARTRPGVNYSITKMEYVFCIFLVFFSHQASLMADIYKWVDENGRVHYGDKPGNDTTQKLNINENQTTRNADLIRESKRQKLLDVLTEERQKKKREQEKSVQQSKDNKIKCGLARKYLASIQSSKYLMEETADPYNPKILSDVERQAATDKARNDVNHWCTG